MRIKLLRGLMVALFVLLTLSNASGPWVMLESHTTANLRGIHAVGDEVAWASGADGTVLRTLDRGAHWEKCAVPPGGEKLDFRGVWAWDANNAIVMSAGPGELSRVYRTVDGCAHWTEEARNKDKDGFWDAMVFQSQDYHMLGDPKTGVLIGDPVGGRFHTETIKLGSGWFLDSASCVANDGEASFAASNSSVVVFGSRRYVIGTGGKGGPRVLISPLLAYGDSSKRCMEVSVPLANGSESAGVFSLAFRDLKRGIAVGGDYRKPENRSGTAAWTVDGGRHWAPASKPPHGYRSSVAWDASAKVWIAVGTNGTDISRDGGDSWQPLDDGNWNAVWLPYVVGPGGRIGKAER